MHVMCLQIGNLNKNSLVNITVLYLMCNKTKLSTVQEVNFLFVTLSGGGGGGGEGMLRCHDNVTCGKKKL